MSPAPSTPEPENGTVYSVEILAEISGVSTQTILQYHEHGLIHASKQNDLQFTDESLRALRRIEHLRELCETNLAGLKLLTQLLDEVETLRAELRARR
jgi:DNA-binding transcriptional MerR regulator